ncbi:MAG: carbohydrate porin [Xanthomonadales bacterium]|nr:carbohydrate porin [Xanthomonadales bacterium]
MSPRPATEIHMQCKQTSLALALALVIGIAQISFASAVCAGETRFGGTMFFDITHLDEHYNDTGTTDASGYGLDVKRFYFGVNHTLDDTWSLALTTDANYSSSDGQTNLFVKKAYVEGAFSSAAVLRIGSADTPWIGYVDKAQGFRYVEKGLVDRSKFGSSADWGLHLGGTLAGEQFDYAVSVVSGRGYKNISRSGRMDVEARLAYTPTKHMVFALGAYSGTRGKDLESTPAQHTARRVSAMVAYIGESTRIGADYFQADDWNTVTAPVSDTSDGWSAWASHAFDERYTVFARMERARPSRDLDSYAQDRYAHLGLEYAVTKGFDLALVWKQAALDVGSQGVHGTLTRNRRTHEIGAWGQVAF